MHLGLIDRPFMPHNLISAQDSPVPLPKFQMAPRLKTLMSSGSKKGPHIYYPSLSKSSSKGSPSRFPNGARMERCTHLQGIFTTLVIYLFTSKALRKHLLSMFPQRRAPMQTDAHSRALLNIYRVSIKSFSDYKHLLEENYVEYIFLPLLKLVSKILCHVFIVTFDFWMQHFQTGGLGEMVRHPGHHDRRILPTLTSFYGGMLRIKCFRHQFQILQI